MQDYVKDAMPTKHTSLSAQKNVYVCMYVCVSAVSWIRIIHLE